MNVATAGRPTCLSQRRRPRTRARAKLIALWQYARRHGLLSEPLDQAGAGATAISRRFQLALAWLATGALLGAALPVLGVAVIVAFNVL